MKVDDTSIKVEDSPASVEVDLDLFILALDFTF